MDTNDPPLPEAFDTPIDRATVDQLPLDTLDNWLASMRDRRLSLARKVEQVRVERTRKQQEEAGERYDRQYELLMKQMTKMEELEESIAQRLNKMRALLLEMEDT